MNKIGDEEKKLDRKHGAEPTESSFAPHEYKPTSENPWDAPESLSTRIQATPHGSDDVNPSPYFLPCHYFTYAAGTSTGGYKQDATSIAVRR